MNNKHDFVYSVCSYKDDTVLRSFKLKELAFGYAETMYRDYKIKTYVKDVKGNEICKQKKKN